MAESETEKTTRVLTTEEIDGILTEKDRLNKNKVVMQCIDCRAWTTMDHPEPMRTVIVDCEECGGRNYDRHSIKSLRTYRPLYDKKRRPKKRR